MGLRLFWERTEEAVFRFDKVQVFTLPRARHWYLPRKETQAALPINTGFETTEGEGTANNRGVYSATLFGGRTFDKTKKAFLAGARLLSKDAPQEAAEMFRHIISRDDSQSDAYFALVLCSEDAQEQLEAVDRALLLRKQYTRLSKEAGVAFWALFFGCDGRQIRVMNDTPGLELLAAEIFQNHGKLEDACRVLERSQHADLDMFRFSRGDLLVRLRRYEEAIDVLRRLNANPHLAGPSFYLMGLSLEKLGYHTTAVQVYRGCLKSETVSLRLEAAIRLQMIGLLEREEKQWLAQRERERLSSLEQQINQN